MSSGAASPGNGNPLGHQTSDRPVPAAMRPFDASLPMALLRARESAVRLFRPLLAAHDLTEQQWRVLRALTANEEASEPTELARQTFLLAPSLSRILSNLEGRGLINRSTAEHDQRRAHIKLSDRGRRMVEQVAPWSEATYGRIEEAFGRQRLQQLLAELHALAEIELKPTMDTME